MWDLGGLSVCRRSSRSREITCGSVGVVRGSREVVWASREEVCGLKNKFGGSGEEVRDLWKGL